MDGLKVSQLAERAGVPATTLRFYEQHGLLEPRRSASGYRLFDDDAVDQLRFIATAKSLGLSLDEVRTLLSPWRRQGCREVQRALAPMLEQRTREARDQIAGLQEFAARLDEARRLLDTIDREGPCDASCAFLSHQHGTAPRGDVPARSHPPASGPTRGTEPAAEGPSVPTRAPEAPAPSGGACSLPGPSWRGRRARWARLLVHATSRRHLGDRVRVELDSAVLEGDGAGELVALVRAEQDCCPSLSLTLTVGPAVIVEAFPRDGDAAEVADALFGPVETPGEGSSAAGAAETEGNR
ncbi:MAG: MerR family transcriptional regulator [Pseudonocardiaceae bacterium]